MGGTNHLETFKLFARFKGALPAGGIDDGCFDSHLEMYCRAIHALSEDPEDRAAARETLIEVDSNPDDDHIRTLYARWHDELFGAPAPIPGTAGGDAGHRTTWTTSGSTSTA